MANRNPLILDADNQRIRELPAGDNLDLTGNNIVGVRDIIPEANELYDLGSDQNRWKDLYLSGATIIMAGGEISFDAQTGFAFAANGVPSSVSLDANDTDDLSEGSSNLYFTTARVDSHLSGGTGVTYTAGEISIGQAVGTNSNVQFNDLTLTGDLTVQGSQTILETATLQVEDQNIELGKVDTPTNTTANTGGITVLAGTDGDKTWKWLSATNSWTSSEHIDVVGGKEYKINGNKVLDSSSLGSSVVSSSLTSVGTLNSGSISSGFGNINIGSSTFTGNGSGLTNVDAELLNGQNAAHYLDYNNFTNTPSNLSDFGNDENFIKLTDLSAAGDLNYNSSTGEFSVTTYKSTDFDTDFSGKDTGDLTEGTNLYFTTARARDSVSATGDLTYNNSTGVFSFTERTDQEVRNLLSASGDLSYNSSTGEFSVTTYKSTDFDTDFSGKDTDDLSEGSSNLYFTTVRIDNHLSGGTGVDYSSGSISIGQSVDTTDNVTFNSVNADNVIQSTPFFNYGNDSNPIVLTVTIAPKTSDHPYFGSGSGNGYLINGFESPALKLSGVDENNQYVYRFDQSDSSNAGHPLRFYEDPARTIEYTKGVTTVGTPGSAGAYTEIAVDRASISPIYYMCSVHPLMGNYATTESVDKVQRTEFLGTVNNGAIDLSTGNIFKDSPSSSVTYSFNNPPSSSSQAYGFTFKISPSANIAITWPSSVKWPNGSVPSTPESGTTSIFVFTTFDGGTSYYGFLSGEAFA